MNCFQITGLAPDAAVMPGLTGGANISKGGGGHILSGRKVSRMLSQVLLSEFFRISHFLGSIFQKGIKYISLALVVVTFAVQKFF